MTKPESYEIYIRYKNLKLINQILSKEDIEECKKYEQEVVKDTHGSTRLDENSWKANNWEEYINTLGSLYLNN